MRWPLRIFPASLTIVILTGALTAYWFFFYSGDLPDIKGMIHYAPTHASRVSDPCLETEVVAIP